MKKTVKVTYNADTLQTEIIVDGQLFDTSRINGKEIADWAYPFMMRKVKWNGFYDEMVEALGGEKAFDLVFKGSEEALAELKEAWEEAPVTIIFNKNNENDSNCYKWIFYFKEAANNIGIMYLYLILLDCLYDDNILSNPIGLLIYLKEDIIDEYLIDELIISGHKYRWEHPDEMDVQNLIIFLTKNRDKDNNIIIETIKKIYDIIEFTIKYHEEHDEKYDGSENSHHRRKHFFWYPLKQISLIMPEPIQEFKFSNDDIIFFKKIKNRIANLVIELESNFQYSYEKIFSLFIEDISYSGYSLSKIEINKSILINLIRKYFNRERFFYDSEEKKQSIIHDYSLYITAVGLYKKSFDEYLKYNNNFDYNFFDEI